MNGQRYIVRPKARRDVAEIADYLATEDLDVSDRFIDDVQRSFEFLSTRPYTGSARRFRRPTLHGLRLWRVPNFPKYLIIYRPTSIGIEVIRVLHGARKIERLLGTEHQ